MLTGKTLTKMKYWQPFSGTSREKLVNENLQAFFTIPFFKKHPRVTASCFFFNIFYFQFLELTSTDGLDFLTKLTQSTIPIIQNVGNKNEKNKNKKQKKNKTKK